MGYVSVQNNVKKIKHAMLKIAVMHHHNHDEEILKRYHKCKIFYTLLIKVAVYSDCSKRHSTLFSFVTSTLDPVLRCVHVKYSQVSNIQLLFTQRCALHRDCKNSYICLLDIPPLLKFVVLRSDPSHY